MPETGSSYATRAAAVGAAAAALATTTTSDMDVETLDAYETEVLRFAARIDHYIVTGETK